MFAGISGAIASFCAFFASAPSVARMILRSVSRSCRFSRSTGVNQPESRIALTRNDAPPCVTCDEKELSGEALYCPVRSRKPYTAATILPFGGGRCVRSRVVRVGGVSVALLKAGIGRVTQPTSDSSNSAPMAIRVVPVFKRVRSAFFS